MNLPDMISIVNGQENNRIRKAENQNMCAADTERAEAKEYSPASAIQYFL